MCGYMLWAERRTEAGWRWLKRFPYSLKKEGDFERAFAEADELIRVDRAETGLSWSRYRLLETNCRGDCLQLDLGSGAGMASDFDSAIYPGSAFQREDRLREAEEQRRYEELLSLARSGALGRSGR